MNTKSILIRNAGICILFTFFFFLVTQKVYNLPFSYGDDHRVLGMLHPERVSAAYKASLYGCSPGLKGTLLKDMYIGRFRPLTWSYDKLLCLLFDDNTHLFRLSNLIILFLSAFFLLGIFQYFEVDSLSSILVLALYVFGRNNETWWTLIPPPQNVGEMFLLAGIFLWLLYRKKAVNGFYILPSILFFLSCISKESFIFCISVILLTDYFFFNFSKQLFAKEYLFPFIACFIPFLCLFASVIYAHKVYSYPYQESVLSIAGYNLFQFIGAAVFFLAPITLLILRWKYSNKDFLIKLLSILAVWTIIQLMLLKGIKLDDQHHYLIPWLIYPLILTAISFSELRKQFIKGYFTLLILYSLAILLFVKNTHITSKSYSASLQAYYTMIDAIKNDTSVPEIIYLSNSPLEADWIKGTRVILDNMGVGKELCFASIPSSIPLWEENYAKHSLQNVFRHVALDSVFFPNGKWVILVETPAKNGKISDNISFYKRMDSSFVKINGTERFIPGEYYYFSVPYSGNSVGDLFRGKFNSENSKGFYAIKMRNDAKRIRM